MPAVWFAMRRSMRSNSGQKDVYNSKGDDGSKNLCSIIVSKKKIIGCGRSGCSRSIANLKDVVIHGSKRHIEKPPVCSPRSIGSSELLNSSITHEVVVSNSTCELRISTGNVKKNLGGSAGGDVNGNGDGDGDDSFNFVGMLKPGTPGPGRLHVGRGLGSPIRRTASSLSRRSPGFGAIAARPRSSFGPESHGALFCHKCGEQLLRWEAVEAHHLLRHAVTELVEGDSSRKIVEIICRSSHARGDNQCGKIERILKVHNMQQTLTQFEEYRELVKIKASRLTKKHPRCLADGNELLRFHGAALECNLGLKGSSSLCTADKCRVCRILRNGFSSKKELTGGIGVFTASTSSRALESVQVQVQVALEDKKPIPRKALIVCRVIAGRVHKPLENMQEIVGHSGFDSLAGKLGLHSNIEELYLLSPRALLPCFVVIYRP